MDELRIIEREEWGMRSFRQVPMRLPVKRVAFHHSTGSVQTVPLARARQIDRYHHTPDARGRTKNGFAYSYGIGYPDLVFEGKGSFVGAHTRNYNSSVLAICFFGDFTLEKPPDSMVITARKLVTRLKKVNYLTPEATGHPHNYFVTDTTCPGKVALCIPEIMTPWELPVPEKKEEEFNMKPFLLIKFDGEDLIVAQYGPTEYRRVIFPQYQQFLEYCPVITVSGQDAYDIKYQAGLLTFEEVQNHGLS